MDFPLGDENEDPLWITADVWINAHGNHAYVYDPDTGAMLAMFEDLTMTLRMEAHVTIQTQDPNGNPTDVFLDIVFERVCDDPDLVADPDREYEPTWTDDQND